MVEYEKDFVPVKYEISEPESHPKELGALVHLEVKRQSKEIQKGQIVKVIVWCFLVVAVTTALYGFITENDQVMVDLWERTHAVMALALGFYFGRTNAKA